MRRRRKRRFGLVMRRRRRRGGLSDSDRSTAVTNRGTGKQGNRQESLARGEV